MLACRRLENNSQKTSSHLAPSSRWGLGWHRRQCHLSLPTAVPQLRYPGPANLFCQAAAAACAAVAPAACRCCYRCWCRCCSPHCHQSSGCVGGPPHGLGTTRQRECMQANQERLGTAGAAAARAAVPLAAGYRPHATPVLRGSCLPLAAGPAGGARASSWARVCPAARPRLASAATLLCAMQDNYNRQCLELERAQTCGRPAHVLHVSRSCLTAREKRLRTAMMFRIGPAGPHTSAMPAVGHAVPARRHGTVPGEEGDQEALGMPHSKSRYNLRRNRAKGLHLSFKGQT